MSLTSRPLDRRGLAARERADAAANAALMRHLEGVEGQRNVTNARAFRADPSGPLVAEAGAAAFGALLERHPAFAGARRPMLVGRAVAPAITPDPERAMGDAVQLLLDGALALQRLPDAGEAHARALMNVAFGGDRASEILRRGLFEEPEPDPLGDLTDVLGGFGLQELCALEIYDALSGMAGGSAGSAKPLEGAVITSVSAAKACAGQPVVIEGRGFGNMQAADVGVWFLNQLGSWEIADNPDPRKWSDERIEVKAPPRVGHGCVAILVFSPGTGPGGAPLAGAVGQCLPAYAAGTAGFEQEASKPLVMSPPCVDGGPTWLEAGPPQIRNFATTPEPLAPNQALTVTWAIRGATRAELTVEAISGAQELGNALGGPAVAPNGTITTPSLPGASDWRAALVLRAWNDCNPGAPVERRVEVSMVALHPFLDVPYPDGQGFAAGTVRVQTGKADRSVFDDAKPIVVLLHGAGGDVGDMRAPLKYPHHDHRIAPQWRWVGPATLPNFGPWGAPFLDADIVSATGHERSLNDAGYRTVNYSQVDPNGSVNAPTAQLVAIVKAIGDALPRARLAFVAHSRGGLVLRGALKVLAGTALAGRIRRVITAGAPHQGSALARPRAIIDRLERLLEGWDASQVGQPGSDSGERLLRMLEVGVYDEMVPGSAKLLELADGEAPLAGVTYYTVGGTSARLYRVKQWWYTLDSAFPRWSSFPLGTPGFIWAREEHVLLRIFEDLPAAPPEVTDGLGDILVANSRASLPFATHATFPVNHAELLWDPAVRDYVLRWLEGS